MNDISRLPCPDSACRVSAISDSRGEALIVQSGLFDAAWYLARNPDVAAQGIDPLRHYLDEGWREGRNPNPYFDIHFYLAQNPRIARAGIDPLLHYILAGEAHGLPPSDRFEPAWFAAQHLLDPRQSPLAHFLTHRFEAPVSPVAAFDARFYLDSHRDLVPQRIDLFEHYLNYGYREGRDPSASFDTKYYLHRYLDGSLDENPLMHWRRTRHLLSLRTRPSREDANVYEQARRSSRPGPAYEDHQPLPEAASRRAKLLAYYLPQFHAIAENSTWWGQGYTEWTAISRGMPRFEGHYQPRIPGALGFYDLSTPDAIRRQIALAHSAGIHGFVHYFYWFNGQRLLQTPTELMLADRSLDFPFCLMWANENWSRRWDGSENEVLIRQDYRPSDEPALLAEFARHFADPRYIRLSGRPLLMLYRCGIIPHCAEMLARWREAFRIRFNEDPIILMAQSFDDRDPARFGCDGAIEFPPHKLTNRIRPINQKLRSFDHRMRGQIYAYDDLAAASLAEPVPDYPLIRCAVPSWDNDARRQGAGMALAGAHPDKYQAWLSALIDQVEAAPVFGEKIVAINAWNEWAEGAYLEPDVHFGAAYLNATARAVARRQRAGTRTRLLLVGHDAFPAGAQMLLLHIARQLIAAHGVEVEFLLLGDGRLLPEYSALAPTSVARDRNALDAAIAKAVQRGVSQALVNSSAAARAIAALDRAGIGAILLVHELPRVMAQYDMLPGLRAGLRAVRRVIFPAARVAEAFPLGDMLTPAQRRILPQGLYSAMPLDADGRNRARLLLGVPEGARLVLGAGHGDLRKGIDLFLQAAQQCWAQPGGEDVHVCWLGDIAHSVATYLTPEIDAATATGRAHFPGFRSDVADFMNAADVFALTSREDPFPSVALEALASGIKVVAFEGSGGIADLLADPDLGATVPSFNARAFADTLMALTVPLSPADRAAQAEAAAARFDFPRYTGELLAELRPHAPRISAAVLSYNYARHLPERLGSIFTQAAPVEEVLLLDDASTDDSVAIAQAQAADWKRSLRFDLRHENCGSVFRQWQRAASLARGAYLWIAEADDAAAPDMLERLAALLQQHPDIDLAFCDSRAIDPQGETVYPSYLDYYRQSGINLLLQDGIFPARQFLREALSVRNAILNASAVIMRTDTLRAALTRCARDLDTWRVAGDWRVYVEVLRGSAGKVGYLAAPLNHHRRHEASVTARLPMPQMRQEIARMHKVINTALGADPARRAAQKAYLASLG